MSEEVAAAESVDEVSFWVKIKDQAKRAGRETIEKVLWLFYALKRPETPLWAKSVITGALAYFVLPIDAIPDVLPGVGYVDDAGAIAAAIGIVGLYINQSVKDEAAAKLKDWFG